MDLKIATAYVLPLGGKDQKKAIAALARNANFMRGLLAKKIKAKFTPRLLFRIDDSFEKGAHIEGICAR